MVTVAQFREHECRQKGRNCSIVGVILCRPECRSVIGAEFLPGSMATVAVGAHDM